MPESAASSFAPSSGPSPTIAIVPSTGNGAVARKLASPVSAPTSEKDAAPDAMNLRVAVVTEFESGDFSRARTRLPIELRDRDVIDVDRERQREIRGRGRGTGRRLDRQRDMVCAETASCKPAREQCERAPLDDDVVRRDRRLGSVPRETRKAHRRRERTGRAFDGETAAARRSRARSQNGRPASDNRNATPPAISETNSTTAPSEMWRARGRRRRGGGVRFGRIHRSERQAHREMDAHLPRLLPVRDVESRNGPIGVRTRAPTP